MTAPIKLSQYMPARFLLPHHVTGDSAGDWFQDWQSGEMLDAHDAVPYGATRTFQARHTSQQEFIVTGHHWQRGSVHTSALHWATAVALALILGCSHLLDGAPDEVDAAKAVAESVESLQISGATP